jgi:class 3 adenylate cyclase
MEYTVLGDTVNVAARLQDKAVAGPKLVGEDTYTKACAELADRLVTKAPIELPVKGRKTAQGLRRGPRNACVE